MEGELKRGHKGLNKMQGLQREEALVERPAERAEETRPEMERGVAQTEVGSNEGGRG